MAIVTAAPRELDALGSALADLVPELAEQLLAAHPGRVYREALAMLEKPLLVHALRLTGGSQLRAARLIGVNRNTLRKRCRELGLPTSKMSQ
ncbi:MAG TPA: helix-turn-helix domain-containing protein [Methylomirabilota bacterium]|jgi:two-component system nitrogen regulation response regulator GlnG|nr:helix-turn-helix domain-containing protein [Methylomirabilota bacterium]